MDFGKLLFAWILAGTVAGCAGPAAAVAGPDPIRRARAASPVTDRGGVDLPDGLTADEAVERVLLSNPGLKAARAASQAAGNVAGQVVWPPFPMAGYAGFVEPVETREGPARNSLFLQQPIPFPGKLVLRGRIAGREAEAARQGYLEARNRLIEETRGAVYELAWVHEAVRITEETRDLLQRMEEVAREKYKVDKATQQDVLKAQVELSRTANDLLALEDDRQSAVARLIALLDRPATSAVGRPAPIGVREDLPPLEELYKMAREGRPEIGAARAAVRKAESTLSLRKEGYIPDFNLGLQYTQIGGGPDAYGLTFGLTLPLWIPKIRSGVKEGERRLESGQARLREVENRTLFEVKDNHARWKTATRLVRLYRDTLIPQAEQSYGAAEAGYLAGKVDFLDYLDSQRSLLDFRLEHERAKVEAQKRLAALERAVGRRL